VNLNQIQRKITIIKIYAPPEDEEANTKDQFFAKLNGVIADIGNTRELFLFGDVNGRTRKTLIRALKNLCEGSKSRIKQK